MKKSNYMTIIALGSSLALGSYFGYKLGNVDSTEKPVDAVITAPDSAVEAGAEAELSNSALAFQAESDEAIVRGYLARQKDAVEKKGPVALSGPNPLSITSPVAEPEKAAPAPQPAIDPVRTAPEGDYAEPVLEKTSDGRVGTTHAAPFVDAAAQASNEAKAQAFLASGGKNPVIRIGSHPDGSAMTEAERAEQIRMTLSRIPDEWTIVYKAPNERVRIYVFTDTTCPYCKKLHVAMPELLEKGVSVHYLMFPRDQARATPGTISKTAQNMMNIWCAPSQTQALDDAFDGYRVPDSNCADPNEANARIKPPVLDHFAMGSVFGVNGTPTIYASNGVFKEGFGDAQSLLRLLGLN